MATSIDPAKLSEALLDVLPPEALDPDVKGYEVDGMTPALVASPATQQQVASLLGLANRLGAAVVPSGGGTQRAMGMPPQRYDVALDLRRIDALVEHEPADLTVTVEAGMRLSQLQRLLGGRGQWLPLDPPLPDGATVGGVLATNASGAARLSRGTARDLLIGVTVATAQGELVKSGGRVVKNVAGYDLGKLHIGALGTAGVILQTSFKVAPLPPETAMLAVRGELARLSALGAGIIDARLALQGMLLSKAADEAGWTLAARFAGGRAAVERSTREAAALAAGAGLAVETMPETDWRSLQTTHGAEVIARASLLPAATTGFAAAMAEAGASVVALPGVGIVYGAWHGAVAPEALRWLRQHCVSGGGALVLEKAPPELKQAIGVWGEPRGDFALMQRLKQEMDPNRVLNPGRFVGGV